MAIQFLNTVQVDTDVLYVDTSSDRVGIGDTTPLSKLEVAGSIKSTNYDTSHTSESGVTLGYNVTESMAYLETWTSKPLTIRTYNYQAFNISGNEAMRIDSNGNIGIGTTSPGGRRLSVVKDTGITSGFNDITEFLDTTLGSGGSVSLNIGKANSSKNLGKMAFKYASSGSNNNSLNFGFYDADNLMTILAGGNVGIGTTNPSSLLHLQSASSPALQIKDTTNNVTFKAYAQDSNSHLANTSNHDLFIDTNNTARITVKAGGNVGIGTTSPSTKLNVQGVVTIKGSGTATTGSLVIQDDYGSTDHLGNIGWNRSAGGPYLAYGIKQDGSADWKSTFDNFSGMRSYMKLDNNEMQLAWAPAQQTTVDTVITGLLERFTFQLDSGTLKLNAYDGTNQTGTPTYLLGTDASGNIVKTNTVPGSGAGPYLPLSAGSSYPLTGTLYGTNTNWSGSGDYAGSLTLGTGASTQEVNLQIGQGRTGNGYSYIDLIGDATYTDYGFRMLRGNTGANALSLLIHRGTGNFEIKTEEAAPIVFGTTFVERMRITSAGNVGIGTTNPSTDLHVNSENAEGSLTLSRGGSNMVSGQGVGSIVFPADYNGTPTNYGKIVTYANALSSLRGSIDFKVKSTSGNLLTGLTVYGTSSGVNIGIGTTSPNVPLEVNGVNTTSGQGEGLRVTRPGVSSQYISIDEADGSKHRIRAIGNKPFEIFSNSSSHGINFSTNSTQKMTILANGNVGIGTTSPTAPLDVFGVRAGRNWAINNRAVIRLDSNGTSVPSDILFGHTAAANQTGWTGAYWSLSSRGSSASNKFYFYRASGNPTGASEQVLMTFDPNLKVGIGTTSPTTGKLVVSSSANQLALDTGTAGDGRLNIGHFSNGTFIGTYGDDGGAADLIRFGTHSGDERMRITSDGNVGIGVTSNTTHKLIVSGGSNIASFRSEGSGQNLKKLSISTGGDRAVLDASTTAGATTNFAFQTGGTERMRIGSAGAIKFNSYDSTNNTGTPTYLLGTDASGNVVKTKTGAVTGTQVHNVGAVGATAAWRNMGTFTAGQGGNSIFIKIVSNNGYNATISQNYEVYIRFKTSNGGSTDANGFAADSSFYTTGPSGSIGGGNIKWVADAAGTSATTYTLYVLFANFTGSGSFYVAENSVGSWVNSGATATDPGAASSTVLIPQEQFRVGSTDFVVNGGGGNAYFANSNVGIGTTSPGVRLDVNGAVKTNSIFRGDTLNNSANTHNIIYRSGTSTFIAGGDKLVVQDGGNVGIGTTNPGQKLHVDGNIRVGDSADVIFSNKLYGLSTGDLTIFTSGNTLLTQTGNVGIGTTSPQARLDVQPTTTNRKVTRISNDVMSTYFYNSQVDAVLAWTCGSYYQAEVVITANQTNGGTTNNLYIRGIWSNNHTSHHWDELEHIGSLTGSTFTMSVGQNGSTAASGRLELDFNYISGSFSQLNVRVTDFYGSHSYTIT